MAKGRDWTRDELLLAMNLYCKLPFGQLHRGNPEIARLAAAIRRTPSSVAMKLCNLASLDPALAARGIKGLTGSSRADRAIWDEFQQDWEARAAESEALAEPIGLAAPPAPVVREDSPRTFAGPTEIQRLAKVRRGQSFFRQAVLASYGCRCCVTGLPESALLVASHILPWATNPDQRVNPRNGLCLSRTYDGAFDAGLITFDEAHRLVLSRRLRDHLPDDAVERHFVAYEGKSLRVADKFRPDPPFLAAHRERVFVG